MAERILTIDPYIASGGIYGQEIEVNEDIAGPLMQVLEFNRDVYISRESKENGTYSAQGTDTISLSKAGSLLGSFMVEKQSLSTVTESSSKWHIGLLDQEIYQSVDGWMTKNFSAQGGGRSGQQEFKRKFVQTINEQTSSKLDLISMKEKNKRFKTTAEVAALNDGALAASTLVTILLGKVASDELVDIYNIAEMSFLDEMKLILSGYGSLIAALVSVAIASSPMDVETPELAFWEKFIPNPQLRARLKSKHHLSKHGSKLIQLREVVE